MAPKLEPVIFLLGTPYLTRGQITYRYFDPPVRRDGELRFDWLDRWYGRWTDAEDCAKEYIDSLDPHRIIDDPTGDGTKARTKTFRKKGSFRQPGFVSTFLICFLYVCCRLQEVGKDALPLAVRLELRERERESLFARLYRKLTRRCAIVWKVLCLFEFPSVRCCFLAGTVWLSMSFV
jgi:hypothetical protein